MTARDNQEKLAAKQRYDAICSKQQNFDLSRGRPGWDQIHLSDDLDGILQGDYTSDGVDTRNYSGAPITGLPAARKLFAPVLQVAEEQVLVGGNSSLTLMYHVLLWAHQFGISGPQSAWCKQAQPPTILCPVPGYDRHFTLCEALGINMHNIPMNDDGPDMDEVESLVANNSHIKGLWCVPRFSNPSGQVYSTEVVERIAQLKNIASENFLVLWDNAYAIHAFVDNAPEPMPLMQACMKYGTEDSAILFGSTSKMTFAGGGVGFLATTEKNLAGLAKHFATFLITFDKVNQLRHVRFFGDLQGMKQHMAKHAALIAPRFQATLEILDKHLAGKGMGEWNQPQGGYFVSFNTLPGKATEVVRLATQAGLKLTPAGATFPYGKDPNDSNLRLAPTSVNMEELRAAMECFCACVELASLN